MYRCERAPPRKIPPRHSPRNHPRSTSSPHLDSNHHPNPSPSSRIWYSKPSISFQYHDPAPFTRSRPTCTVAVFPPAFRDAVHESCGCFILVVFFFSVLLYYRSFLEEKVYKQDNSEPNTQRNCKSGKPTRSSIQNAESGNAITRKWRNVHYAGVERGGNGSRGVMRGRSRVIEGDPKTRDSGERAVEGRMK